MVLNDPLDRPRSLIDHKLPNLHRPLYLNDLISLCAYFSQFFYCHVKLEHHHFLLASVFFFEALVFHLAVDISLDKVPLIPFSFLDQEVLPIRFGLFLVHVFTPFQDFALFEGVLSEMRCDLVVSVDEEAL